MLNVGGDVDRPHQVSPINRILQRTGAEHLDSVEFTALGPGVNRIAWRDRVSTLATGTGDSLLLLVEKQRWGSRGRKGAFKGGHRTSPTPLQSQFLNNMCRIDGLHSRP